MHVKEIMTSPVTTITPDTSLADAARQMLALDVGMLPVANGQKIVGVVSDRDITVRAVAKRNGPRADRSAGSHDQGSLQPVPPAAT